MKIIQETFIVPDSLYIKLLTGEYIRVGGIIRYAGGQKKGQIVKHLDTIDLRTKDRLMLFGNKMLRFSSNHKVAVAVGGAIVVTGAITGIVHYFRKTRELDAVMDFRLTLRTYIEEIRVGNLRRETIYELSLALHKLTSNKDCEEFLSALKTEEFRTFVNHIQQYTTLLARLNQVQLIEVDYEHMCDSVLMLQNLLDTQKQVFELERT